MAKETADVVHIASARALRENLSISESDHANLKLMEIARLLWLPEGKSEEEKFKTIVRAVELFESLAPQEGAEGMLAMQMVGTHFAALECLRRAMIPEQLLPAREHNLRMAEKFMNLYSRQLETLNKHRGKGQQKVVVEHVNVEPGGQAIVGNVETSRKSAAKGLKRKAKAPVEDMKIAEPYDRSADGQLTENYSDGA